MRTLFGTMVMGMDIRSQPAAGIYGKEDITDATDERVRIKYAYG